MIRTLRNKKILVTCGPTWVAIDPVRVISNISSGEMGHRLARGLLKGGAKVTLLEGPVMHPLDDHGIEVFRFRYFEELEELLRRELRKGYAAVIHAAAVADFRSAKISRKKINSHAGGLLLRLIPTPKLINDIKKIAPQTFLIGFKLHPGLTSKSARSESRTLFRDSHCDLVVANTLSKAGYRAWVLNRHAKILFQADSRQHLADQLTRLLAHCL